MKNAVKDKLKNGEVVFGTWMQIPSQDIASIIGDVGFGFCVADLEHTDITMSDLKSIYNAIGENCLPGARVAKNELMNIRKPLDIGAKIVIVPLINNKKEAEAMVNSAKYPPKGIRGFAFCRANKWGVDFDEYVKECNDNILLIAMIESKEAVSNIDEILSVDGIDGVLIGPYDLSGSFGKIGQLSCEEIYAARQNVVLACKKFGKFAGEHLVRPTKENIADAIKMGYTFLPLGMDVLYLHDSMNNILTK